MAAMCSRIFLFYNLIYSMFLYLLPKKLKHYLPNSHTSTTQQVQNQLDNVSNTQVVLKQQPANIHSSSSARMDQHELTRIFQMFDKNGDGRITKQELNDSLENMNIFICDNELVQLINNIDANGDGCVDIDEFGDLYKTIMDDKEDEIKNNEEEMMEAFNVFDQNRDGFIAVEELRDVLESLGIKQFGRKGDDECRKMIMKVDVDGDGMVSFDEFKEMMKSGGFVANTIAQS
uniref:calmodulin-like protein 3 n=1 Tax=Erigeron canadensis TaxID=72917 RepID=UPI001CB9C187|nr:calmodulin-like protein 3 [Erigeron canadensis]